VDRAVGQKAEIASRERIFLRPCGPRDFGTLDTSFLYFNDLAPSARSLLTVAIDRPKFTLAQLLMGAAAADEYRGRRHKASSSSMLLPGPFYREWSRKGVATETACGARLGDAPREPTGGLKSLTCSPRSTSIPCRPLHRSR